MEVGFGEGEGVGVNTAVSVEPGGVVVVAGIAESVEAQGHEERKVGVDRLLAVGIGSTVAPGDGKEAEELGGVGVGKVAAGADVAAVASRIDYHHNRSSRTEQTARQDAVAEPAEVDSIGNCKLRN